MADDEHPAYHDSALATMYRLNPEKLAALRRAMTGMTRCPECDALNRADQKRCEKCGAKLYPDVKDDEDADKKYDEYLKKKELEEPPYKED